MNGNYFFQGYGEKSHEDEKQDHGHLPELKVIHSVFKFDLHDVNVVDVVALPDHDANTGGKR